MSKLRAIRRPLIVSFVVCCLGAFALLAVTQALAARRPFGIRLRPAARSPASATPAPTPAAPSGVPTPARDPQRPEPQPLTADAITRRDDLVRAADHQDEEVVMQEILEIRRRIGRDPSFRGIVEACQSDGLHQTERYETSEPAFKRILQGIGSGSATITVRKKTCDHDGETAERLTAQSQTCDSSETCHSHASCPNALRMAARALDARANDCEDAESYARADELRELARQLRKEARNGDDASNHQKVFSFFMGGGR